MNFTRRAVLAGAASAAALSMPAVKRATAQGAPIRIGLILPITGIGAELGKAWLIGAELAVDQWNANGGVLGRQVELVVRDDKYNAAGSVAAGRELVGMGVNLLIAGTQSPMALALSPILSELNAVCVAPTPAAMSLTHENYHPNFFRLYPNAFVQYYGAVKAAVTSTPDATEWAAIAFDSAFGHDGTAVAAYAARKELGALGKTGTFEAPIFVPQNKPDFKIELNQLMNSPATGLYIGLLGAPAISFLQQGRSIGLFEKFKVMAEAGSDLLIGKAMKQSTPRNLWSVGFWYPKHEFFKQRPLSTRLYDDYVKKTGDIHPTGLLSSSHRAVEAMLYAIQKAGGTGTSEIISALEGLSFEAISGPFTIRKEDHQGVGISVYGRTVPADADPFYVTEEVMPVEEAAIVEPPSPGQKFEIPT